MLVLIVGNVAKNRNLVTTRATTTTTSRIIITTTTILTTTTTSTTMSTPAGYPSICNTFQCRIMFNSNPSFRAMIWRRYYGKS